MFSIGNWEMPHGVVQKWIGARPAVKHQPTLSNRIAGSSSPSPLSTSVLTTGHGHIQHIVTPSSDPIFDKDVFSALKQSVVEIWRCRPRRSWCVARREISFPPAQLPIQVLSTSAYHRNLHTSLSNLRVPNAPSRKTPAACHGFTLHHIASHLQSPPHSCSSPPLRLRFNHERIRRTIPSVISQSA